MTPILTMRQALEASQALACALVGPSWQSWRIMLLAAMGERLTAAERAIFAKLTGREREPRRRIDEFVAVVGRRGGKSRAMALLATYLAGFCEHKLAPGERGVLLCVAPDQRQAAIILDYVAAFFALSPMLYDRIVNRVGDTLELKGNIAIEVRAGSFRRLRGPTYIAAIADESAFWYSDDGASLNPDTEILNAIRPGLGTTGGMLVVASSPYARRGALWDAYRQHYGSRGSDSILVCHGATRDFNPTFSQRIIDAAIEQDAPKANAEYGAVFRTDLESFVSREAVAAVVVAERYELPPVSGTAYHGFVDPAGGSGSDAMTLAVAHASRDGVAVLDALREVKPPFSPEAITADFAALLKSYGISTVTGDHYAGEWPREQFRKHGVTYDPSDQPKSAIYGDLLPLLNSGRIELLDHARLFAQLVSLERRTGRVGRDTIDHPPKMHDDVVNAVCGSLLLAAGRQTGAENWIEYARRLAAQSDAPSPAPAVVQAHAVEGFMQNLAPKPIDDASLVEIVCPGEISTVYATSGRSYNAVLVGGRRVCRMSRDDAVALLTSGAPSSVPWAAVNADLIAPLKPQQQRKELALTTPRGKGTVSAAVTAAVLSAADHGIT
jgi:hypothetical protein